MGFLWIVMGLFMFVGAYAFYVPMESFREALQHPDLPAIVQYVPYLPVAIFGLTGLILILVGIFSIINGYKRPHEVERLKTSGLRVEGEIVHLEMVTRYRVNNRSPYRIHVKARHPVTHQETVFVSDFIWTDPHMQLQKQKTAVVYVDAGNSGKYFVDTGFLMPPLA